MSISVQVNLSNFDALSRCFDCLCEQYPEAVGQAMMNVAQNILATANTCSSQNRLFEKYLGG
jgi:hypothetical protein